RAAGARALAYALPPVLSRALPTPPGVPYPLGGGGATVVVARGGRYLSGEETATGMSLYPDALLRAVPAGAPRQRVFIPLGADPALARALRAKGLATLAQLGPADTPVSLRCTHILDRAGGLSPVTE
ncbi:MAG: hypothetical protein O9325_21925, partial [Roseomonas sp.]|nr:hypothetical protein [Roseomonas sp.]